MIRQLLLAFRLATYVAALTPFVVPNTLSAQNLIDTGASLESDPPKPLPPGTIIVMGICKCKKIAPGVCFLNQPCPARIAGKGLVLVGEPVSHRFFPASQGENIALKILETGYSLLKDIKGEESGYGLYSYALMTKHNSRSAKFLSEVFSAIPPVEDTAAQRSQTNIFYTPIRKGKVNEFPKTGYEYGEFFVSHTKDFYDYKIARTLLNELCNPPAEGIKAVCDGDLSRGPFVFTYAKPASGVTPVPPPFLLMDLSNVHERAFPEIIAAFRAQVKRDDISDRAKIDTLRLKLLSIVLTAADFVAPVHKAMADIVHITSGQAEDKK